MIRGSHFGNQGVGEGESEESEASVESGNRGLGERRHDLRIPDSTDSTDSTDSSDSYSTIRIPDPRLPDSPTPRLPDSPTPFPSPPVVVPADLVPIQADAFPFGTDQLRAPEEVDQD